MRSLFSRLTRRKIDLSDLRVTVYTRRDCCCCHKAIQLLEDYQHRYHFAIDETDIDADPELVARYGATVPVIEIGGKVRFHGVINPILLDRLLLAESRAR